MFYYNRDVSPLTGIYPAAYDLLATLRRFTMEKGESHVSLANLTKGQVLRSCWAAEPSVFFFHAEIAEGAETLIVLALASGMRTAESVR